MSTRGAPDSWLGTSGEWGLTAHKHGEMCDELSDHLSEMARVESHGAAQAAKETLSQPKVRRKLAGVHLADQVYATLNRLPNKQEWRELLWLGVWFVLVLIADYVAYLAGQAIKFPAILGDSWHWSYTGIQYETPPGVVWPSVAGWLLQGIARAGFYSQFVLSLFRAYKTGWGVLFSRVLQLKLIHTVMIIGGAMLFRSAFDNQSWVIHAHPVNWPHWLIAPVVVAPIAIAAVVVLYTRQPRLLGLSWGLALAVLFLYPGGPTQIEHIRSQRPFAYSYEVADGERTRIAATDPEKIQAVAKYWKTSQEVESVDVVNNLMVERTSRVRFLFGHGLGVWNFDKRPELSKRDEDTIRSVFNDPYLYYSPFKSETISTETQVIAPVCFTGAGLGWLTAAIPLLAIFGSVGLLLVMGRRGMFEFLAYSAVVAGTLVFTLAPCFFFAEFAPSAVITMPFRFLTMIIMPNEVLSHTTTLGLLLSAGAPWLLTGLFLKPQRPQHDIDDPQEVAS